MKIVVSGTVRLCVDNDNLDPVNDPEVLRRLDGAASERGEDDAFAGYIDDPTLRSIGISGGFIDLRYDADANVVRVVTEYDSPQKISLAELQALKYHTTEQWSDGLGESFECEYVSENGLFLDLAPDDQVVEVSQGS